MKLTETQEAEMIQFILKQRDQVIVFSNKIRKKLRKHLTEEQVESFILNTTGPLFISVPMSEVLTFVRQLYKLPAGVP